MMNISTVVSEWKEHFGLFQPILSLLFGSILFVVIEEATNYMLTSSK